jgi:hypothetical protein
VTPPAHPSLVNRFELARTEPRLLRVAHGVERFEYSDQDIPGFHRAQAVRLGLLIAGLSVFGASYVSVAWLSLATPNGAFPYPAIPVAGPLILGGALLGGNVLNAFVGAVLIADGVGQIAGLAILLYSLARPAVWLERDAPPPVSLSLVPGGVGVSGHF